MLDIRQREPAWRIPCKQESRTYFRRQHNDAIDFASAPSFRRGIGWSPSASAVWFYRPPLLTRPLRKYENGRLRNKGRELNGTDGLCENFPKHLLAGHLLLWVKFLLAT